MALIQDAVVALLARVVFWRSSQGKRLGVDRLSGGRPPMTIHGAERPKFIWTEGRRRTPVATNGPDLRMPDNSELPPRSAAVTIRGTRWV